MSKKYNNYYQEKLAEEPQAVGDVKLPDPVVEVKPTLTHDQIHDALMFSQEMYERATMEFILIGDVAKQIMDTEVPRFEADKLEFAILKRHFTESGRSILDMVMKDMHVPYTLTDESLDFTFKGVPVHVKIIDRYVGYLQNPNSRFYTVTEFKLPNPFNEYWEKREQL